MVKNPTNEVSALLGSSSTGSGSGDTSALTTQITTITQQLQQLQTINQTEIDTIAANTTAVGQNTGTKGSSGQSTGGKVGSALEDVFGLGLSPLISGLVGLFGGGGSGQPAPLVPYVAPPSINLNAGIGASQQGGAVGVDTADGGLPRTIPSFSSQSTTQITVQVQALDSQSFLDHSHDIAQAVRQAMLTSTTLNDVIREV
jgi:hypothetical protein